MTTSRLSRFVGIAMGSIATVLFAHLWWRTNGGRFAGPFLFHERSALVWDSSLLIFFCATHSIFAGIHRVVYLLLTLIVTALIWTLWGPSASLIWSIRGAWSLPFYGLQLAGLAGHIWGTGSLGLNDLFGESSHELHLKGAYAYCRHPIYFFTVLMLFTPYMTSGRLLISSAIVIYIWVGSELEERKLLKRFGAPYATYRRSTPRLIPIPLRKK